MTFGKGEKEASKEHIQVGSGDVVEDIVNWFVFFNWSSTQRLNSNNKGAHWLTYLGGSEENRC